MTDEHDKDETSSGPLPLSAQLTLHPCDPIEVPSSRQVRQWLREELFGQGRWTPDVLGQVLDVSPDEIESWLAPGEIPRAFRLWFAPLIFDEFALAEDKDAWVTPSEVAELKGVSRTSVYEALKRGTLEGQKFGGQWLVFKGSLAHYQPRSYPTREPDPQVDLLDKSSESLEGEHPVMMRLGHHDTNHFIARIQGEEPRIQKLECTTRSCQLVCTRWEVIYLRGMYRAYNSENKRTKRYTYWKLEPTEHFNHLEFKPPPGVQANIASYWLSGAFEVVDHLHPERDWEWATSRFKEQAQGEWFPPLT